MEKVKYKEIDFDKLMPLNVNCGESKVFHNGIDFYKFYNTLFHAYKYKIPQKLKILSQLNIEEAIIPQKKICDCNIMRGFVASYKPNTQSLSSMIYDLEKYLIAAIKASNILRKKLHQCEIPIIVGDMHFSQILVDEYLNVFWCDCDSYKVGKISSNSISVILRRYIKKVTGEKDKILVSSQTDRLGMFLCFMSDIFRILQISCEDNLNNTNNLYIYEKKAEQYKILQKIQPVFKEFVKTRNYLPDVPYLDEMISVEDTKELSKILK